MTDTAIKICGITEGAVLEAAIAARADYAGFVFFSPSPRNLVPEQAAALAKQAAERIDRVGVFVDPDDDLIEKAIAAADLDALQLHEVTAARRAQIHGRFGLPIWAVIAVRSRSDIETGPLDNADRIVFDARTPEGSAIPGGLGLKFDWSWLTGSRPEMPWGLAGGLSPTNVAEAVRMTGAPMVDTSSGVESAPGVKDPALIRSFCAAVRAV